MHSRRTGARFDLVELAWVASFCAVVGIAIGAGFVRRMYTPPRELDLAPDVGRVALEKAPLAARFGPYRYSQYFEEWILRDFFGDRRGGFFVDVGASDYREFSNTYYLEKELGWSGLAIDALPGFADGYRKNRPRTRFFSFFVSDRSDESATLHVLPSNSLVSSEQQAFTERRGNRAEKIKVRTITLDDLLSVENVHSIDLLSVDIELAEPSALSGFTISRFKPALVCIEAHPEVRQAILDYFSKNDYVLLGKYLRADVHNLYFVPRT